MNERIRGVLAPVVTPFKPDLSPDPERLIGHCKWLLSQKCGLAVFGTNSEANSMSAEERMTLLDALVAAGVDPARMMPGTGCCSISETVELTAHAVKHGCAGVLMLPPFYYKNVSEEGLYRCFSEVVQRVGDPGLRIYLYHIPPVAVVGITPKLVERLLQAYPIAIAGMKDSSGDWNNTKTFLDAFAETARPAPTARSARTFDVFVGSESFLLANMRNGGVGTISATANVNPAAIHELYTKFDPLRQRTLQHKGAKLQPPSRSRANTARLGAGPHSIAAEHGDQDLEHEQAKLNVVREVFARKSWPSMIAALKQAIAIYGNDPEWARVRPPLVELTTEQARKLAAELEKIEFIINLVES
ncbi:MAG: dihydrodipicolinate synthase family protein [Pseudolabrys sp.]